MKKFLSAILAACTLLVGASSALAMGTKDEVAPLADGLSLTGDSHLILDFDSGYIDKIDGKITTKKLKSNFDGEVTVKSPDGAERADADYVATDDIVSCGADISVGAESIKALIYGDVNRDGEVNLLDVVLVLRSAAGQSVDIAVAAADVDADGSVTSADAVKLLRKIAGWENISLGNVRMVAVNEKITVPAEDASIDLFFTSPMLKVGRSETESSGIYAYKMMMAKSETESAQIFLVADAAKEGLSVEMSDFEYEYGDDPDNASLSSEIFIEYYYNMALFYDVHKANVQNAITDEYYGEVMLPYAATFELTPERSQGFMINVTSTKDTKPGMYRATFNVKDADGNTVKSAYVYAYVWDFTLPDTPYSASAFGLDRKQYVDYEQYYEFLLTYNLTPSEIPYDLRDSRADAYMSDPRVTSFRTCGEFSSFAYSRHFGNGLDLGPAKGRTYTDETIAEMQNKLRETMAKVNANAEWKEKSYFTIIDEPYDMDVANRLQQFDDWMIDTLGNDDFNLMLCIATNVVLDQVDFIDTLEFVKPYLEIWCPQSRAFTLHTDGSPGVSKFSQTRSYLTYGNYIDRLDDLMSEGDHSWWYLCVMPEFPYPNYFTFYQGVIPRTVLWQQYMFGVEGILYWGSNTYSEKVTPNKYDAGAGDGQILYSGEVWGYTGPAPSHRMIQIRDSFDDYDYMAIAEALCGRDAVITEINRVTKSILDYTEDYRDLEAARKNLGQMIEDAIHEN